MQVVLYARTRHGNTHTVEVHDYEEQNKKPKYAMTIFQWLFHEREFLRASAAADFSRTEVSLGVGGHVV